MSDSEPRFVSVPPADLVCARWDDQCVLFHRSSGRTHFVNESTLMLLDRVLREPRDIASATEELARLSNLPLDERVRSHVHELMLRLDDIGLLVRA